MSTIFFYDYFFTLEIKSTFVLICLVSLITPRLIIFKRRREEGKNTSKKLNKQQGYFGLHARKQHPCGVNSQKQGERSPHAIICCDLIFHLAANTSWLARVTNVLRGDNSDQTGVSERLGDSIGILRMVQEDSFAVLCPWI